MSAPGIDPRVLDALQSASSLELFQLSTLIERLLADPRRIIAVRKNMHLGQAVRFVDWRDGSLREGKVVAMRMLPSLETVVICPVSAQARLHPEIPISALRNFLRSACLAASVNAGGSSV